MQVDVAEPGQIEHPLRNQASVADNHDPIWLEAAELRAEFVVGFDTLRLADRKAELQRRLFNRRSNQLQSASLRTVWLSHHQTHPEPRRDQLFQRRHRKLGSAAEDETKRLSH